ncbi:dolichyl-phosphate hexose transferase [Natrinema salsiterrestre]|uniref:Glycosyltransferase family 2 protein n=1 Tax=Natrinema salsiterrestre TaxID=2950540 RepID=A0A9Q4KZ86_9EURY|nr:dolichyl-phosphate hexose transferase [Natrinema salsiterrestre]MDF9744444.1 glycosyltransferase family 2 protein [Natrinema salsiterrestre]
MSSGEQTETTAEREEKEYTFDDISVVMGTYNEEEAIGKVLSDIEDVTDGKAEVVCVDGSSDRTPEIAREHGATVIEQEPQGYGVAVRAAILEPDRPIVVTTDCDDTYPMEQLPEFLALINDGHDVVSGDRLYHGADAMPGFNRFGNQVFAAAASVLMGTRVHDTTTGMRAYRRDVVESIEWTENTGLSAELLIRPLMRGYDVREHPIEYRERAGQTKLDPLQGGLEIARSIVKVSLEERLRELPHRPSQ